MIPANIKSLFVFVSYLHSNKKQYKQEYLPLIDEVLELGAKRSELNPRLSYKDKLDYDIIQKEIGEKFQFVYSGLVLPILDYLRKLELWDGDDSFHSVYNKLSRSILEMKREFTKTDVKTVQKNVRKYIDFRSETKSEFLSLAFLFEELDELIKELADFFVESPENLFLTFQKDTVIVNSFKEAILKINSSNVKVVLPINNLSHNSDDELKENIENKRDTGDNMGKANLTIKQIALIHAFEWEQITRTNAKRIVESYGYTSGEKLFQWYTFFSESLNRKAKPNPCTAKTLKNKIKLFESIIPLLSTKASGRALDEVKILRTIYDREF